MAKNCKKMAKILSVYGKLSLKAMVYVELNYGSENREKKKVDRIGLEIRPHDLISEVSQKRTSQGHRGPENGQPSKGIRVNNWHTFTKLAKYLKKQAKNGRTKKKHSE